MARINLLTQAEKMALPTVLMRRQRFQKMIDTSVANCRNIFSNSLLLSGRAGTGKTTLVLQELERLSKEGKIAGYERASGHVTPSSLFKLLEKTARLDYQGRPTVLVLDDVDCISQATDIGCYELLKSALDTKSDLPTNRQVYYMNDQGSGFTYRGFCIIITNNPFNPDKVTAHQEALLDRVQMVNVDLKKDDMFIYNAYLVENYLNDNPDGLSMEEIEQASNLFNNEVRKWYAKDAFRKARINFSIRLMKKFVDANRMFQKDWRGFNMQYQRLEAACDIADVFEEKEDTVVVTTKPKKEKVVIMNPKTGKPYSSAYINMLKREGRLEEKMTPKVS